MRHSRINFAVLTFAALAVALVGANLCAQTNQSAAAQRPDAKKEAPKPESIRLVTEDGVELHAHWFPGTNGKLTVPIILLHDWDSSRRRMLPLAEYLQKELGHAVIVPDLRGHGESLRVQSVDDSINRDKFKRAEVASMLLDIERCKKFLVQKNDEGELNIDMLALIAVGETCVHAVQWSINDWNWPPVGGRKQGQDVKAIVMISPNRKIKGLSMSQNLKQPLFSGKGGVKPLSVFVAWGANNESADREGDAIYSTLKKSRPPVGEVRSQEERWKKQSLFRAKLPTAAGSGRLLTDSGAQKLNSFIAAFIDKKIVANQIDFRWQMRKSR